MKLDANNTPTEGHDLPLRKASWGEIDYTGEKEYTVSATDFNLKFWWLFLAVCTFTFLIYMLILLYWIMTWPAEGPDAVVGVINMVAVLALIAVSGVAAYFLFLKERPLQVVVNARDDSKKMTAFVSSLHSLLEDEKNGRLDTLSSKPFHALLEEYLQNEESDKKAFQQRFLAGQITLADAQTERQKQWLNEVRRKKLIQDLQNVDSHLAEEYVALHGGQ